TTKAQPFESTDLNRVMSEVLSDLEIRIEQVSGKIAVDKLPMIDADHSQMHQLLLNLIGNALKFHREDANPVVEVSAKVSHGVCSLSVVDNGIGFDEKYLDRIFTIFQRLHGKQEYEGTGVGLAVCRRIVERHGGTITARSTVGRGSSFIIYLPLKH